LGDEIKEDEMGGANGMCGREVRKEFWWGNLKDRDYLKDVSLAGSIILQWERKI
jgi:hypothetical protein